jgi:hypothetical protein
MSANNLAALLWVQQKFADAETLYREALTMQRKLSGNEGLDTARVMNNLANVLRNETKLAEAMHRDVERIYKKLLPEDDPYSSSIAGLAHASIKPARASSKMSAEALSAPGKVASFRMQVSRTALKIGFGTA